jgi:hypothetical protein
MSVMICHEKSVKQEKGTELVKMEKEKQLVKMEKGTQLVMRLATRMGV